MPALARARGGSLTGFAVVLGALVALGDTDEDRAVAAAGVRRQIAFYGSTPPTERCSNSTVGAICTALNRLSRQNAWAEMAALIDRRRVRRVCGIGQRGTGRGRAQGTLRRCGHAFVAVHAVPGGPARGPGRGRAATPLTLANLPAIMRLIARHAVECVSNSMIDGGSGVRGGRGRVAGVRGGWAGRVGCVRWGRTGGGRPIPSSVASISSLPFTAAHTRRGPGRHSASSRYGGRSW